MEEDILNTELYTNIDVPDYTENIDLLYEELINVRELQIKQINNSVEIVSFSFIFMGVIIAILIGLNFMKGAFSD